MIVAMKMVVAIHYSSWFSFSRQFGPNSTEWPLVGSQSIIRHGSHSHRGWIALDNGSRHLRVAIHYSSWFSFSRQRNGGTAGFQYHVAIHYSSWFSFSQKHTNAYCTYVEYVAIHYSSWFSFSRSPISTNSVPGRSDFSRNPLFVMVLILTK